jgi:hypothetical protein
MQYKLPAKGTCCSLGAQSPIHWHPSHQTVSSLCVLFFFPFSLQSLAHLCHLQNLMKNLVITGRNSAIKRWRKMGSNHLQIQSRLEATSGKINTFKVTIVTVPANPK